MANEKQSSAKKDDAIKDGPHGTVTHVAPSADDQTSFPGPGEAKPDQPPVRTTEADTPIAQTLATGAGAHQPPDETPEEKQAKNK